MELIMNKIRKSLIAGSWYPGDKQILEKTIKKYIYSEDRPVLKREIKGLISPHAGYDYSGKVAAKAYGLLEGRQSLNVVILSPLHHSLPSKYVFNSATHYETPLGVVPVNREVVNKMLKELNAEEVDEDREHSIEIQLPFLQVMMKDITLIPIMISHRDIYNTADIENVLIENMKNMNVIFIASSDLHHEYDYKKVIKKD